MHSRRSRADVLRKILTLSFVTSLALRILARYWPEWSGSLDWVVVAAGGARVLMPLIAIARGKTPWQRGIVPAVLYLSVVSVFAGSESRLLAKAAAVATEIAILGTVLYLARAGNRQNAGPVEERILERMELFFPPLAARLITGEAVILRTAALGIAGRCRSAPPGFGYVESSLLPWLPWIMVLGTPADFLLLHFLPPLRSASWTFALTLLDVWAIAWTYGLVISMRLRPHRLVDGRLQVYKGILGRAAIDVANLQSVEIVPHDGAGRASKLGRDGADLSVKGAAQLDLELSEPVETLHWFRPAPRNCRWIRISADDAGALREAIDAARPITPKR